MLASASSEAHPAGDFYAHWYKQADRNVTWHFKENIAQPSAIRDRIVEGSQAWNQTNADMSFDKEPDVSNVFWGDCPASGKSVIFWVSIDGAGGTYYAEAHWCDYAGENFIKTFQIRFDKDEAWYTGESTPPPGNNLDFQAVATHEFGHATGFGFGPNIPNHFNTVDCFDSPYQTMCGTLLPGYAYPRTLESHDVHTFKNRYPP
jgi:hypothetical protein